MQIVTKVKFNKIKEIGVGQGLNSRVWLARDPQLDGELAVKEIDKATFWNPNCFAEAQALYASDHPNIVRVQWAGEEGNYAYIAMPFYKNGSLLDKLASGPMKLSSVLEMAQDVLLGLAHIHSKNLIHLDIKPSNIFLDHKRRALIADFGQCRKISASGVVTAPAMYCRTMPPEFLKSGCVASVSDIYHVGVLLYRVLNGEADWNRQFAKYPDDATLVDAIKRGKFPDRNRFLPHVPKRLRTAIRKALNVVPGDRFVSANEFGLELGRIAPSNDWNVSILATGEMVWRCSPVGCADIVVELKKKAGGWVTEVHTDNAGSRRAKGKTSLWGTFSSQDAALVSLKKVFESL